MPLALLLAACLSRAALAQGEFPWSWPVNGTVRFDAPLRLWDGFGLNYVEAAQTRNYFGAWPQDYGGFSVLAAQDQAAVMQLMAALKPGLLKMFLDVWHEPVNDNDDPYLINPAGFHHAATTSSMLAFATALVNATATAAAATAASGTTASSGSSSPGLAVIAGMYGPAPWMTLQGQADPTNVRGRDLDPALLPEVAEYLVAWGKWLMEEQGLPVVALSPFNEGEDYTRWPANGTGSGGPGDDYNAYWPAHTVSSFLSLMPAMLAAQGVPDLLVTPGETTSWFRQLQYGYTAMLEGNASALAGLGLLTSHGFVSNGPFGQWWSTYTDASVARARAAKAAAAAAGRAGRGSSRHGAAAASSRVGGPAHLRPTVSAWRQAALARLQAGPLHAWVTSTSWGNGGPPLAFDLLQQVYLTGVNGIIPWAAIHRPSQWVGGDPNAMSLIRVNDDGSWDVQPAYYIYKQLSTAGQAGTAVADAYVQDPLVAVGAWAGSSSSSTSTGSTAATTGTTSPSPDSMVVVNIAPGNRTLQLALHGTVHTQWQAVRTCPACGQNYTDIGTVAVVDGDGGVPTLVYEAPAGSVTTFYGA